MRGPRGKVRCSRVREESSVVVVGEEVEVMSGLRRRLSSSQNLKSKPGEGRVLITLSGLRA